MWIVGEKVDGYCLVFVIVFYVFYVGVIVWLFGFDDMIGMMMCIDMVGVLFVWIDE